MQDNNQITIYQTADQAVQIEVRVGQDSVWLTQRQMGLLFDRDYKTISKHILNVFEEGELEREATVAKFATVQMEGEREVVREIGHYNLDVIISVGYRVKSKRGTQVLRKSQLATGNWQGRCGGSGNSQLARAMRLPIARCRLLWVG
jgi:hypothetical protein